MEKRLPELSGRGAWIESGAPALLRKAKPSRTLSLVVRRTAQTVQMKVYPAPHDPYREVNENMVRTSSRQIWTVFSVRLFAVMANCGEHSM